MLYASVTRATHELMLVSMDENEFSRKAASILGYTFKHKLLLLNSALNCPGYKFDFNIGVQTIGNLN